MRAKLFLAVLAFALCFCPLSAAFAALAAKPPVDMTAPPDGVTAGL